MRLVGAGGEEPHAGAAVQAQRACADCQVAAPLTHVELPRGHQPQLAPGVKGGARKRPAAWKQSGAATWPWDPLHRTKDEEAAATASRHATGFPYTPDAPPNAPDELDHVLGRLRRLAPQRHVGGRVQQRRHRHRRRRAAAATARGSPAAAAAARPRRRAAGAPLPRGARRRARPTVPLLVLLLRSRWPLLQEPLLLLASGLPPVLLLLLLLLLLGRARGLVLQVLQLQEHALRRRRRRPRRAARAARAWRGRRREEGGRLDRRRLLRPTRHRAAPLLPAARAVRSVAEVPPGRRLLLLVEVGVV